MNKIEKDYGAILMDGDVVVGFEPGNSGDGFVFKDIEAFRSGNGICYVGEQALDKIQDCLAEIDNRPEYTDDEKLTQKDSWCHFWGWNRKDFIDMCGGEGFEKLAEAIFLSLTGESPRTYFEEHPLKEEYLGLYGLTKKQVNAAWGREYFKID